MPETRADDPEDGPIDQADGSGNPMKESAASKIPQWFRPLVLIVSISAIAFAGGLIAIYLKTNNAAFEPEKLGVVNLVIFGFAGIIAYAVPWEELGLRLKKIGPVEFDVQEMISNQAKEREEEFIAYEDDLSDIRNRLAVLERQEAAPAAAPWPDPPAFSAMDMDLPPAGAAPAPPSSPAEAGSDDAPPDAPAAAAEAEVPEAAPPEPDFAGSTAAAEPKRAKNQGIDGTLIDFLDRYPGTSFSPTRIVTLSKLRPEFQSLADAKASEIRRTLRRLAASGAVRTRVSKKGNTLYLL